MVVRKGDEPSSQQTEWSEDQIRCLILEAIESPDGREAVLRTLMLLLLHDERIREAIGEIAVRAVDKANAELTKSIVAQDWDASRDGP